MTTTESETIEQRLQVTVSEAARMLSYSLTTVRDLIRRGELQKVGHGRGTRIPVASLKAFVERNQR